MRSFVLIAVAALGLVACKPQAADQNYNINAATPVAELAHDCGIAANTLADEKALFAAETAYNIAADAYVRASGTGQLPAAVKAVVQPKMVQAYAALKLARQAYTLGQTCNLLKAVELTKSLATQAKTLLPK